jgi:membrane peptidoglycan carboxypeptidase
MPRTRGRGPNSVAYPVAVDWMRRHDRSLLSNALSLLVCGLLAGVVVAAAAFPVVAMSGLVAKAGADSFDKLPTALTVQQSPQITYVYASDGKTQIATFYDENRRDVPLADVSLVMQQAMVAAEDTRFYEHHGVDIKGVARAFVANQQAGGTSQGASTLTMQYVREAISYSASSPQDVVDATSDTPGRKIREMRYALALEKQLTKQQILERYLNIAPFGHSAFGIYAAAQVYFGKAPKNLTLGESTLLAGLVKAPSAFDPLTPEGFKQSLDRRNTYVLANMVKLGYITEAQKQEAIKTPLSFPGHPTPNGCTSVVNNSWGAFCDYLYRWWLQQPAFGADTYERENRLKSGGYRIVTSLDLNDQAAAVKNVLSQRKVGSPDALMLVGVEPGTGHVQLMAVNRTYGNDQAGNGPSTDPAKRKAGIPGNYPRTSLPLLSEEGYQFGSTFKMFTMLAALSKGMPLSTTINTTNPYVSKYMIDPKSPAACNNGHYCPVNASKSEAGVFNMWAAFGASVNTYFVPLEEQAGALNAVNMAKNLGINFNGDPNDSNSDAYRAKYGDEWGAFTLGVSAATPLSMANAYAAVAADGTYCEPLPVVQIQDFNGTKLDAANPRCRSAIDPDVAHAAEDAARCPLGDQPFFNECHGATAGPTKGIVGKFPIMGKTGTTDHDRTAALIAGTKQTMIAGIIADPDNPLGKSFTHTEVNYAVQHTLHDVMVGKPTVNFTKPSDHIAYGTRVGVPGVKCAPVDDATARLKGAGFGVAVDATPVASDCPQGTVAKTAPSGTASKGSIITVFVSDGTGGGGGGGPGGTGGPGGGGGGGNGGGNGGGDGGNGGIVPPGPGPCFPLPTCRRP